MGVPMKVMTSALMNMPTTSQKGRTNPTMTAPRLRLMASGVAGRMPPMWVVRSSHGMGMICTVRVKNMLESTGTPM